MELNLHRFYTESDDDEEEEDYIDMEVDSSNNSSINSSLSKEFEFQSFSSSSDRDHTTTSPADELFYMGKLLPLHLPPRLEMVQNILENPKPKTEDESAFCTPLFTPSPNTTPFQSCNISPSQSCHVSRELNPEQYFVEYFSGFEEKKSWTKKIKLVKNSKLKWASYLKSLFTKSSADCSDQCSAPSSGHRRSFSGAFKRISKIKTTLSDSSLTSGCSADHSNRHVLKRCSSSSLEMDNPIQGAIAHCKRSQ